jgi:hypothetical protein
MIMRSLYRIPLAGLPLKVTVLARPLPALCPLWPFWDFNLNKEKISDDQ